MWWQTAERPVWHYIENRTSVEYKEKVDLCAHYLQAVFDVCDDRMTLMLLTQAASHISSQPKAGLSHPHNLSLTSQLPPLCAGKRWDSWIRSVSRVHINIGTNEEDGASSSYWDRSLRGLLWSLRGSVRGQTPSGGKNLIFIWQTLPALPCFMQKLIENHHLPSGNPTRAVGPIWGMQTAAPACIYWISASASYSASKAIHTSTTVLYPLVAPLRVCVRICHSHCPFLLALQAICTFL